MSINGTVEERAARLVLDNRYLALATADDVGAWCAPINYIIDRAGALVFYSSPSSRHGKAIELGNPVSGAIYDSTAKSADVDGLQFIAQCSALEGPKLAAAHELYFEVNFENEEERDWFYRPINGFEHPAPHRFYSLNFVKCFVIDNVAMEESRMDLRVEVDLKELSDTLSRSSA